jgi:hypothetical protein
LTTLTLSGGASTTQLVAVGFETSVASNWRCCSGDGTSYSCNDIPNTPVATSTEYTIIVDYSVAGTRTCSVQAGTGATQSLSTSNNLSTSTTTDLGIFTGTTTLAAAVVNNFLAWVSLEQN